MTQIEVVDRAAETALDTVVGGATLAFDTVRRPRGTARRARRRGDEVNGRIERRASHAVDEVTGLPERVLHAYLRVVRGQARREDVIGLAARTLLETVNGSATDAARFFVRIERETELPRRAPRSTARTAAAGAGRAARRTANRTANRTAAAATGAARGARRANARTTATATGRGRAGTRRAATRRSA